MPCRTNYVICAWSGSRRMPDPRRDVDPAFYLRCHLNSLAHLRHNLDQITIMVPHNPKEPPVYRAFLEHMPKQIRSTPVTFIDRPNVGFSYGSFSDAYKKHRTEFDYYFFMEDDYMFVQHEFDKKHLDLMFDDPSCGYLCGLAWERFALPMHAGISNGLFRTEALERVFRAHGMIPHAQTLVYSDNEILGQVAQSQAVIAQGYRLRDWAGMYKVGYREFLSVTAFHDRCEEFMMVPI